MAVVPCRLAGIHIAGSMIVRWRVTSRSAYIADGRPTPHPRLPESYKQQLLQCNVSGKLSCSLLADRPYHLVLPGWAWVQLILSWRVDNQMHTKPMTSVHFSFLCHQPCSLVSPCLSQLPLLSVALFYQTYSTLHTLTDTLFWTVFDLLSISVCIRSCFPYAPACLFF
jgi:hypothetical protein